MRRQVPVEEQLVYNGNEGREEIPILAIVQGVHQVLDVRRIIDNLLRRK